MSHENVELVLAGYRHWNAGDMEAIRALVDPDHRRQVEVTLGDMGSDPVEVLVDEGDGVMVEFRVSGQARVSGIPVNQRFFHVWTVRAGRITRLETFTDEADARKAARGEA